MGETAVIVVSCIFIAICSLAVAISIQIISERKKTPLPSKFWYGWRTCQNCRGMYAEMSSDVEGFCCEECHREWTDVRLLERMAKL